VIYLNQAGTSWPKPAPVREAVAEALSASPPTWERRLAEQHREVCRALGVGDPARLLLTPGATSALAVGIADHGWQPGDRVIVSGLEHEALYRPVRLLVRQGVEVVIARGAQAGVPALEEVEVALRRGGVRLLAVTAASNVTGEILPIEPLIALAHRFGARILVDAAQTAGWFSLDLDRLGADLVAFAGHKALQAPWGIGGLYRAPGLELASPRGSQPGYCDVGSLDRAALAGLVAGLRWLEAPERADRLVRARAGLQRIARALSGRQELRLYGPSDPDSRLPTLAFRVAGRTAAELAASLAERGVLASGGQQCAPLAHQSLGTAPHGVLRLSAGPGNDDGDIDSALQVLLEVLEAPAR